MESQELRLLILGAHPDDAEFHAGGLATIYRSLGHAVKIVSVTNGAAGHHETFGPPLAARRKKEAARAASIIGAVSEVWDFPDAALLPSLEVRQRIVREIRTYRPNIVLTHRPCDYHPDHRAVGAAVQDASYLVTVPAVAADTPALLADPVVAYMPDAFTRPNPMRADVVLDIGARLDQIVALLAAHESQFFEWLPYNQRIGGQVPANSAERLRWLRGQYEEVLAKRFAHFQQYAGEQVSQVASRRIEVFEVSEYAGGWSAAVRERLFPFAEQSA